MNNHDVNYHNKAKKETRNDHGSYDNTTSYNKADYIRNNTVYRREGYHSENVKFNTLTSPTNYSAIESLVPDYERFDHYPHRPLTKQVDQVAYELPRARQYALPVAQYLAPFQGRRHPETTFTTWHGGVAPQFLKVFGDIPESIGARVMLDCVLLGMPRPRVAWLFDGQRIEFSDVHVEDTADLCRLTIPHLQFHHYGTYTVVAENEAGRALASAIISPMH